MIIGMAIMAIREKQEKMAKDTEGEARTANMESHLPPGSCATGWGGHDWWFKNHPLPYRSRLHVARRSRGWMQSDARSTGRIPILSHCFCCLSPSQWEKCVLPPAESAIGRPWRSLVI